ncbi:alpha-hydroxy-acid oxidizing protein [Nocardia sp. NBC_01499]|uniref:alpha-hydroxy acid oxidase n=1 Tax=Nocardia sp. NBC_01499 TaxID=2903597 RepID=UPI003864A330
MASIHSIADLGRSAEQQLPVHLWDFIAGGSGDELTLAANRAAFDAVHLVPRVLVDVAEPNCGTTLFGRELTMPVAVAPMAYQRLLHPDGELATARAAAAAGIPFTVTTLSTVAVEQITDTGADTWFQLYWLRDRALMLDLVHRAENAGCSALILTVDVPEMGRRLRDIRNGFALPADIRAVQLPEAATSLAQTRSADASAVATHTSELFDPGLNWANLEWLRANTRLPIVLKGLLDPRDAALAVEHGVDAIVVSNHGGRQLDGAIPSIDALPDIRAAVGDHCTVLLDSGIRGGIDVLRALALGASAVLLGRPVLWGLAVGAETGVSATLSMLRAELHTAMRLTGCPDLVAAAALRHAKPSHAEKGVMSR